MTEHDELARLAEKRLPVYYYTSPDSYQLQQRRAALRDLLLRQETETTVLDEPAPPIGEVIAAAGTVSFFGTQRLVEIPNLEPAAYSAKDLDAFCDALASAENAVFILCTQLKMQYTKAAADKATQKLMEVCKKIGFTVLLPFMTDERMAQLAVDFAAGMQTKMPLHVAQQLAERCGKDQAMLESETDKLCAACGYTTVTPNLVAELCQPNLDADVFDMVRQIVVRNSAGACELLQRLLYAQAEPVQITATLAGSYIDAYRMKLGAGKRKSLPQVASDFGYYGSTGRLRHAAETASRYTMPQLEACLMILADLDQDLKSVRAAPDIVMEVAVCRMCRAGGGL